MGYPVGALQVVAPRVPAAHCCTLGTGRSSKGLLAGIAAEARGALFSPGACHARNVCKAAGLAGVRKQSRFACQR